MTILQQIASIRGAANGLMGEMVEIHLQDELVSGETTPDQRAARMAEVGHLLRALFKIKITTRKRDMKSRAAVAFGPGQPLSIVEIDVAPPKKAKCWSKSPIPAYATPMPLPSQATIRKAFSRRYWAMKAAGLSSKWGRRDQPAAGRPRYSSVYRRMPRV